MERVFPEAVAALRAQGRKLAEASALVTERTTTEHDSGTWLGLCTAIWQEAEAQGIDDLCIAVTRIHLGFYRRLLFETIGDGRSYSPLNGVFAYPLRLQVGAVRVRHSCGGGPGDAGLRQRLLGGQGRGRLPAQR